MTACCCSGYQPKRDIGHEDCTWPPVLEPAGPWRICDCPEGVALGERLAAMAAREVEVVVCSSCRDPDPGAVIEWSDKWRTYLCPECGNVLAEEAK